jgi:membrane protein YdbS with pleckstrin-like domain
MLNEEKAKNQVPFSGKAVIPFFLARAILFIAAIALALLILLFIPQSANNPGYLIAGAVLAFLLLLILGVFLYSKWYFKLFLFELRGSYLFSRKGVITPDYTMIPYENIQDVHVDQPVIEKALGICNVRIFTATFSARGSETISGLSLADGESFKNAVFQKIKEVRKVVD